MRRLVFFPVWLGIGYLIIGLIATAQATNSIDVFVSVLPQKYFVERVGGKHVEVSVMVGPGKSPATYEPTPRQMAKLADADLYFRIGVPFETVWMDRIRAANSDMKVVDLREGIDLRVLEAHTHEHEAVHEDAAEHDHEHAHEAASEHEEDTGHQTLDPHIWTDPLRVRQMAERIRDTLIALDPGHASAYQTNYRHFAEELEQLDQEIRNLLQNKEKRRFMVFHPAWGYFAERYDLEQIAIERQGKEPGARQLAEIIELAKEKDIHVIFVQVQFSKRNAETIARAIDGRVIAVDPLAENYLINMRSVAEKFAEVIH